MRVTGSLLPRFEGVLPRRGRFTVDLLPVDHVVVLPIDDRFGDARLFERDEAKSPGSIREAVVHNVHFQDLPERPEVLTHLGLGGLVMQTAHEDLGGLVPMLCAQKKGQKNKKN